MALVLTRNLGESIMIGDNIKITLTKSDMGRAQIAIEAPEDVSIYREEIYRRIQSEKKVRK